MADSKFLSFVAMPGVCNKSNEFVDLFFDEKDEDFEAAALEKTVKYPMN